VLPIVQPLAIAESQDVAMGSSMQAYRVVLSQHARFTSMPSIMTVEGPDVQAVPIMPHCLAAEASRPKVNASTSRKMRMGAA
jgi:hypothetical protein